MFLLRLYFLYKRHKWNWYRQTNKKPDNSNATWSILLSAFKLPVPLMEIKFIGLQEILTIFPFRSIKRMILQCEEWEISKCKLIDFFLMNKNKDLTDMKIWA